MTTTPEIASDTDELRGQAGALRAQADALDAALASIESLPAHVQSQAQQFITKHEPRAVYMEKLAELGKTNSAVKQAITSLAGQLRAQAAGLTGHATAKDDEEDNSASHMDRIPDGGVGTPAPQPRTVPAAPQPDMPAVAV